MKGFIGATCKVEAPSVNLASIYDSFEIVANEVEHPQPTLTQHLHDFVLKSTILVPMMDKCSIEAKNSRSIAVKTESNKVLKSLRAHPTIENVVANIGPNQKRILRNIKKITDAFEAKSYEYAGWEFGRLLYKLVLHPKDRMDDK